MGIVQGGNCPGGNCPGGNCPGWELSGGNCPGANCPGANCPVTLDDKLPRGENFRNLFLSVAGPLSVGGPLWGVMAVAREGQRALGMGLIGRDRNIVFPI